MGIQASSGGTSDMTTALTFAPVGDCALSAVFGDKISPDINKRIRHVVTALSEETASGIVEMVPTYASLLVVYDPLIVSYEELCHHIRCIAADAKSGETSDTVRIVEIPTVYGGEYGMDIENVCNHTGLSESEVVAMHSGTDYLVYMLGFIPGFTYLGGMNQALATPRLSTPRTLIPAGSVGIAGAQTGIYPSESPGGWQIIGRTPLTLYDSSKEQPTLLSAGDYVRYVPITEEEYQRIAALGSGYTVTVHEVKERELNGNR